MELMMTLLVTWIMSDGHHLGMARSSDMSSLMLKVIAGNSRDSPSRNEYSSTAKSADSRLAVGTSHQLPKGVFVFWIKWDGMESFHSTSSHSNPFSRSVHPKNVKWNQIEFVPKLN
jgi:hypothetical protein